MQKRLLFVLMFGLLCACSVHGADVASIDWVAAARVKNALRLWQQIVSMREIEPIYQGSTVQVADILKRQHISLPADEWLDESFYLGLGFMGKPQQLTWGLWRGDGASLKFVGVAPSLITLLLSPGSEKAVNTPGAMPLPSIVNKIDAQQSLHLVFNKELLERHLSHALKASLNHGLQRQKLDCDLNLRKLNRAIKRQKLKGLPQNMQLSCPLKGNYSFDSNSGVAVCGHQMPQVEPGSVPMNDEQMRAHKFLELLGGISSFSMFCDQTAGQMVLRLEHTHELMIDSAHEPEVAAALRWFDGLSQLAWVSNEFNSQMTAAPDFAVISQLMVGPGLNFEQIKDFLPPSGPITFLARGEFSLHSNEMPKIAFELSYPDSKSGAAAVEMLKQFGMEIEEDEIFGRHLWKLPVPDMRHRFNDQQAAERAIYIRAENDGNVAISFNKDLAQNLIAVAVGESSKIYLWDDVTAPVKFAYAQTMGSLARGILRLVNSALFEQELHQCSRALSQWRRDNPDYASKLPQETALDDSILSLCPRKAIVVSRNAQEQAKLLCAVHNYEAARLVNYQILDVPVPEGRWLRLRLEKGDGYSQFVADIKSPGGEK